MAVASAVGSDQKDLRLLERVLSRFAVAKDSSAVQNEVNKLLIPTLSKFNSTSAAVQLKVTLRSAAFLY